MSIKVLQKSPTLPILNRSIGVQTGNPDEDESSEINFIQMPVKVEQPQSTTSNVSNYPSSLPQKPQRIRPPIPNNSLASKIFGQRKRTQSLASALVLNKKSPREKKFVKFADSMGLDLAYTHNIADNSHTIDYETTEDDEESEKVDDDDDDEASDQMEYKNRTTDGHRHSDGGINFSPRHLFNLIFRNRKDDNNTSIGADD